METHLYFPKERARSAERGEENRDKHCRQMKCSDGDDDQDEDYIGDRKRLVLIHLVSRFKRREVEATTKRCEQHRLIRVELFYSDEKVSGPRRELRCRG